MTLNIKQLMLGLVIGLAVGIPTIGSLSTADAHSATDFFSYSWTSDPDTQMGNMQFAFDGNQWRRNKTSADITWGDNQWSGVSGSTFDYAGQDAWDATLVWTGTSCNEGSNNTVTFFSQPLSGTVLANTRVCRTNGNTGSSLLRASITMDFKNNWNTGSSLPSSTEYDSRATMTHEMGHAGGFGTGASTPDHFTGTACDAPSRSTMCSGAPGGGGLLGKYWKRTIEAHDKHTFVNQYSAGCPC